MRVGDDGCVRRRFQQAAKPLLGLLPVRRPDGRRVPGAGARRRPCRHGPRSTGSSPTKIAIKATTRSRVRRSGREQAQLHGLRLQVSQQDRRENGDRQQAAGGRSGGTRAHDQPQQTAIRLRQKDAGAEQQMPDRGMQGHRGIAGHGVESRRIVEIADDRQVGPGDDNTDQQIDHGMDVPHRRPKQQQGDGDQEEEAGGRRRRPTRMQTVVVGSTNSSWSMPRS